ncbi:MAG: MFS transporter [Pirellulales bacterium]|nr:MFS transporter [Pirellulales bacterium]
MSAENERLPISEKIGYGLGDCAANFVFMTQMMFLFDFYTNVLKLSAFTVGTIFWASRLWDAINDPIIGGLADRTETRWGKFRPWILASAFPFALLFVLAYTAPDLGQTGKIIWAVVTYNALMMMYTVNNVPYSALTGVMTGDIAERAKLVQWRFVMAMTAQFLVGAYTMTLVARFGGTAEDGTVADLARGYQITIAIWAALAALFFVITFLTTKERIIPAAHQKSSLGADLRDLAGNRSWVVLAAATVLIFIALAMRGGSTVPYFKYYLERTEIFGTPLRTDKLVGWFNGISTALTIVGVLLSKPLAMRFGKRNVFRTSIFLSAVGITAFYLLPPTATEAMFAVQYLMQLIYGVSVPLLWAMMADVADFTEWKHNRRATAMTFAATVFALKLGLSLGGALQGYILAMHGYVSDGVQTPLAKAGIAKVMSLYPALAFFAAAVCLLYYQIDRQAEHDMHDELTARRAANA